MELQSGDRIADYKIVRELGEGAYGKVYLVEWTTKRKGITQGALKILKDPKFKDILEEVTNWARVSEHPNILRFRGAKLYDRQILMLSDFATGGNIEEWVKSHYEDKSKKKPTLETVGNLMLGILSGLEHLHEKEILHRDIKPANILLEDKIPKLADFGLARGLDFAQSSVLGGTLAYMSPKLINVYLNLKIGQKLRYERTEFDDLWATAVVFQQMLIGEIPFESLDAIRNCQPMTLSSKFPIEIREFLKKALAKEERNRFQTAKEMREALATALNSREDKQTIIDKEFEEKQRQKEEARERKQRERLEQEKREKLRREKEEKRRREERERRNRKIGQKGIWGWSVIGATAIVLVAAPLTELFWNSDTNKADSSNQAANVVINANESNRFEESKIFNINTNSILKVTPTVNPTITATPESKPIPTASPATIATPKINDSVIAEKPKVAPTPQITPFRPRPTPKAENPRIVKPKQPQYRCYTPERGYYECGGKKNPRIVKPKQTPTQNPDCIFNGDC